MEAEGKRVKRLQVRVINTSFWHTLLFHYLQSQYICNLYESCSPLSIFVQNKKRKASALLAISELNDAEKAAKKIKKDEQAEDEKVEEIKKLETSVKVTSKPLLEGEEYEELKRRLRERKKALSCNPIFRLKAVGEEALMNRKSRVPLFMSDIQVSEY